LNPLTSEKDSLHLALALSERSLTLSQAFDNLDCLKTQKKPGATSNHHARMSDPVHSAMLTFLQALDRFDVLKDQEEQNAASDD
jgi:hypothetical protein